VLGARSKGQSSGQPVPKALTGCRFAVKIVAGPFVQRAYSVSLAIGLTTILTTVWVLPPKYTMCRILIF
jgi:hypothetical protein